MLHFRNVGEKEMLAVAGEILRSFPDERFYTLTGDLGSGKTTLIKMFCEHLVVESFTTSPTYALVNEYFSPSNGEIFHCDFYRVNKLEEVFDIGYEYYFFSGNYCFVEWGEKIKELLPTTYVQITIETQGINRNIIAYLSYNKNVQ